MALDPLEQHDIEVSRRSLPAEKLAQALEMMESGFRLKQASLRHRNKDASPQQLEEALVRWQCCDD